MVHFYWLQATSQKVHFHLLLFHRWYSIFLTLTISHIVHFCWLWLMHKCCISTASTKTACDLKAYLMIVLSLHQCTCAIMTTFTFSLGTRTKRRGQCLKCRENYWVCSNTTVAQINPYIIHQNVVTVAFFRGSTSKSCGSCSSNMVPYNHTPFRPPPSSLQESINN